MSKPVTVLSHPLKREIPALVSDVNHIYVKWEMTVNINRLDHIVLTVMNIGTIVQFYVSGLGITIAK